MGLHDEDPGAAATIGDTVADSGGASRARRAVTGTSPDPRYQLGPVLGRGGMGEVRLAHDERIERDVAIKLLRADQHNDDAVARFLREARVQGQLEHPAVVPVHDLGVDRDGNPYFVMKRLAGATLAQVIAARARDPVLRERWSRRLLLARFVEICLAMEFAHTRGVVHRDLKPANIMLGDFGEVYVLDWGLARATGEQSIRLPRPVTPPAPGDSGQTVAGEILGTPGYMPPEQIRGEQVDARADVYALGCVLYELLTGSPPLPFGLEAVDATLAARELRPSVRFPDGDVPPELDEVCARATAADRTARPTARWVAETIQAYLDGDRDLAARRELARHHAQAAQAAAAGELDDEAARGRAMREAGRALALDAGNRDAAAVLGQLMLVAPRTLPVQAQDAAEAERGRVYQVVLRSALWDFGSFLLMMPVFLLFTIHHAWPIIALATLTAANAGVTFLLARRPRPMDGPGPLALLAINCGVLAMGAIVLGPLLLMPVLTCASIVTFTVQPARHPPWLVLAFHLAALFVPLALEWTGVLPPTYHLDGHGLLLTPWTLDLSPTLGLIVLLAAITVQVVSEFVVVLNMRRSQELAQDRLHAQRWHLEQLVPRRPTTPA